MLNPNEEQDEGEIKKSAEDNAKDKAKKKKGKRGKEVQENQGPGKAI